MIKDATQTMIQTNPASRVEPSDEMLSRLVYLMGPTRSGTSVIFRSLGLHPRTMSLPGETYFVNRVWKYRNRIDERTWRTLLCAPRYFPPRDLIRGKDEFESNSLGRRYAGALKRKSFSELYKLYPLFYSLSNDFDKELPSLECWIDKANNWRGLLTIRRSLPMARFVFVVRDPRSVILSNARRNARRKQLSATTENTLTDIILMSLYWRFTTLMMLRFTSQNPGSVTWVRYEDFVQDPCAELNRLYTFMVGEGLKNDQLETLLQAISGGATNSRAERYEGISKAPMTRWRDQLDQRELSIISSISGKTAESFGYELRTVSRHVALSAILSLPSLRNRMLSLGKFMCTEGLEAITPKQPPQQA